MIYRTGKSKKNDSESGNLKPIQIAYNMKLYNNLNDLANLFKDVGATKRL